jgi:hypothetical protein
VRCAPSDGVVQPPVVPGGAWPLRDDSEFVSRVVTAKSGRSGGRKPPAAGSRALGRRLNSPRITSTRGGSLQTPRSSLSGGKIEVQGDKMSPSGGELATGGSRDAGEEKDQHVEAVAEVNGTACAGLSLLPFPPLPPPLSLFPSLSLALSRSLSLSLSLARARSLSLSRIFLMIPPH